MATPSTSTHDTFQPRRPLDNQRNIGGDMSMMFFACPRYPKRFVSPNQHQIKGLNVETVAGILFPPPTWATIPEYSGLLAASNTDSNWGFFSLNLSMYNQTLEPSEWDDMWFHMYGRVHPYALTWEVDPDDSLDSGDNVGHYTIPALIIRDQGYQP
jgi:hypothetical protein